MPFPWKKVKSTRISRLVNDHLHKSQKRRDGSSLVVETGFPTSLVDLFIKNREKLRKLSKKKGQSPPLTSLGDGNDPLIAESGASVSSPPPAPSPVMSLSIPGPPSPVQRPLGCSSPPRSPSRCVNEILLVGSSDGGKVVGVMGVNEIVSVVLKLFLVVCFIFGMKRLTVGITVSAFLLLFLEYVGEQTCGLLKQSCDSQGALGSMVRRVCVLLTFKEVKLDEKSGEHMIPELQQEHSLKPGSSYLRSSGSRCRNQEIEIVDTNGSLVTQVDEIQSENEIAFGSCLVPGLGCDETESREVAIEKEEKKCEVAELKTAKSRRAKMKLKMKKFFPKKLRSRKEHDCQRLEIVKEDGVFPCDGQEVYPCRDEEDSKSASGIPSIASARNKEEDAMNSLCAFNGLPEVNEEADTKRTQKGEEIKGGLTWRYMFLCLIILIGLIGGRAFALLLTLSWCLLVKLGEALPRYTKVPRIRCFDN
jgi:hypothetical protein